MPQDAFLRVHINQFLNTVRRRRRYLLPEDILEWLQAVSDTAESRSMTLSESDAVWRTQRGCAPYEAIADATGWTAHLDWPVPFDEKRMRPRPGLANEGRANPKGIPVFYCASDSDTAIAEQRPWPGLLLSLASFSPKRPIRVVNCSADKSPPTQEEALRVLQMERLSRGEFLTWLKIGKLFGEPVTATDDQADYVPTQILAELFRDAGFDGIAFQSTLSSGLCFAFFDDADFVIRSRRVIEVSAAKFEFNEIEIPGPYIAKHADAGPGPASP